MILLKSLIATVLFAYAVTITLGAPWDHALLIGTVFGAFVFYCFLEERE